MLEYCLNCDYENELNPLVEAVTVTVRGENFKVTEEFYQCPACGEKFTSNLGHDALDEAYREYRSRHNMLQPEEIRQWREKYRLTQTELCNLLAWDIAILNRYENGALQDKSDDTLLQFIMEPQNLLNLITSKPYILSVEKQNQLIAELFNQSEQKKVDIITSKPEVMSGIPVFANTRVPIKTLIDYFKGGKSINNFLDGFPMVSREQVMAFLSELEKKIVKQLA